jgi:hypothetical protein
MPRICIALCVGWAILPIAADAQKPNDPYFSVHSGWESRPLDKLRKTGELVFQADFSPAGLARDWQADGVTAESKDGAVVIALSPEALS